MRAKLQYVLREGRRRRLRARLSERWRKLRRWCRRAAATVKFWWSFVFYVGGITVVRFSDRVHYQGPDGQQAANPYDLVHGYCEEYRKLPEVLKVGGLLW